MIHVCYALRDESGKYSKFVGASIESLLENTREEVTIHVIHDSTLSRENRKKLTIIVYRFNQEIEFYDVEELAEEKLEEIKNKYLHMVSVNHGVAIFYRYLMFDVIPKEVDRAIYLDADIIVNHDINELWRFDLEGKPLAASPEYFSGNETWVKNFAPCREGFVDWKDYFNTGVLIFDMNQIRRDFGGGAVFASRDGGFARQSEL